jgi:hypothetical protein
MLGFVIGLFEGGEKSGYLDVMLLMVKVYWIR